ncbi:MAG: DUF2207 domain-containing protein [Oscillospiraceae bacterium]
MKVNKKVFELSSLKKYRQYERKLWLIPLVCLIFIAALVGKIALAELIENPDIATVFGIVMFLFLQTLILSVIPFFIGKIIIKTHVKTTILNCTITNMHDFDYYREKLTGLSPATISILTDLDIEQKKDVAASVLQYENLGLLTETADNTYRVTDKYYRCNDLNESDRYLIKHLEKGDFDWENDANWKNLVIEEAVSEGYVKKKGIQNKGDSKKGCLVPLAVFLGWFLWVESAMQRLNDFGAILDTAPENMSLAEQVNFLSQNNLWLGIIEIILLFVYMMFMVAFVLSATRVGAIIKKNAKPIKRTEYGNYMAECIYGMKNFIHDYSNLSEADKRYVVLWEDYLVYAVVLEENMQIVNEISRTRGKYL